MKVIQHKIYYNKNGAVLDEDKPNAIVKFEDLWKNGKYSIFDSLCLYQLEPRQRKSKEFRLITSEQITSIDLIRFVGSRKFEDFTLRTMSSGMWGICSSSLIEDDPEHNSDVELIINSQLSDYFSKHLVIGVDEEEEVNHLIVCDHSLVSTKELRRFKKSLSTRIIRKRAHLSVLCNHNKYFMEKIFNLPEFLFMSNPLINETVHCQLLQETSNCGIRDRPKIACEIKLHLSYSPPSNSSLGTLVIYNCISSKAFINYLDFVYNKRLIIDGLNMIYPKSFYYKSNIPSKVLENDVIHSSTNNDDDDVDDDDDDDDDFPFDKNDEEIGGIDNLRRLFHESNVTKRIRLRAKIMKFYKDHIVKCCEQVFDLYILSLQAHDELCRLLCFWILFEHVDQEANLCLYQRALQLKRFFSLQQLINLLEWKQNSQFEKILSSPEFYNIKNNGILKNIIQRYCNERF
ncbi:hypothetical protein SNEBB_003481 [Seison nebaliae]|nr:hypothetical protein SNEBB_003481 [Seison nebaliae]